MAARTMGAAVWHGPFDVRAERIDVQQPGAGDVLLAVDAVGICGSDLHVYRRGMYGAVPGTVMGHEFSGTAVEVGDEVLDVRVGERFTGYSVSYCGTCYWCLHGQPRMCPELFAGFTGYGEPGAMAEFVRINDAVRGENLIAIPDSLESDVAALAEPVGVALYTLLRTKPETGATVVVLGAGMIGNLIIQALKATRDVKVIVTEVSPARADLAREAGADLVLDASRDDLFDAVQAATGPGRYAFGPSGMADLVIDAAAAPPTFNQALEFVRGKGTVCLVGSAERPALADTGLILHKDIRLIGIFGSVIQPGMDLLAAGKIRTDSLITDRFALQDARAAFARANEPTSLKVMMHPTASVRAASR